MAYRNTKSKRYKMAVRTNVGINFTAHDNYSNRVDRMGRRTESFMQRTNRNLRQMDTALGGFGGLRQFTSMLPFAGVLSGAGLFHAGKGAIDAFAKRESVEVGIKFLTDKGPEGEKAMDFLNDITDRMGINFHSASDGLFQFLGSTKGLEMPLSQTLDWFEKISATSRAMNLDSSRTTSVYRAFAQMLSKGKVQAEELRLQLGDSLYGAVPAFAASAGISMAELEKLMETGQLHTSKYLGGFIDYLYNTYGVGMEEAAGLTKANMARIENYWDKTKSVIGDSLVSAGVVAGVKDLTYSLQEYIIANKSLIDSKTKAGVDSIKEGLGWIKDNKEGIIEGFYMARDGLLAFTAVLAGAKIAMLLTNPVTAAATGIAGVGIAIGHTIREMERLQGMQKDPSVSKKELAAAYMSPTASLLMGAKNFGTGASHLMTMGYLGQSEKSFTQSRKEMYAGFGQISNSLLGGTLGLFSSPYKEKTGRRSLALQKWADEGGFSTGSTLSDDVIREKQSENDTPAMVNTPTSVTISDVSIDKLASAFAGLAAGDKYSLQKITSSPTPESATYIFGSTTDKQD